MDTYYMYVHVFGNNSKRVWGIWLNSFYAHKSKTFKTKRHYFQHLNDYRGLFVIKALSWLSKDYCCTNLFLLKSTRLYWGLTFASLTSLTAYDVVSDFSHLVKKCKQQSLFWLHQVQVRWCYSCVDLLT